MNKRAEERARTFYSSENFDTLTLLELGRKCFSEGYEQAEKDLALTWEDVKKIEDLCMEVATLFASVGKNKVILEPPFYEEVLRRFNEQRKK